MVSSFYLSTDCSHDRRETISFPNAFHSAAAQDFCARHHVSSEQFYLSAWAVVVSQFLDDEEVIVYGRHYKSDEEISIQAYQCQAQNSKTVAQVISSLQTIDDEQINLIKQMRDRGSDNWQEHLKNSCVVTRYAEAQNITRVKTKLLESFLDILVDQREELLEVCYESRIFSSAQVRRLATAMIQTITTIVEFPSTKISDLKTIGHDDVELIHRWNSQKLKSVESLVHEMIWQKVLEQPDALAVSAWDGEITYAELEVASNILASDLARFGVKTGTIVPVLFEKSLWWVVAMLATLKAGGAPVALSPDYPTARSKAIVDRVEATVIVTSPLLQPIAEQLGLLVVIVDQNLLSASRSELDFDSAGSNTKPDDVAFLQFTSGSTGEPKGIVLEHRTFCSVASAQLIAKNVTAQSRVLQFAAHTFDASLEETFVTLIAGGLLCIPSEEQRLSNLEAFICEKGVNWAIFTPTLLKTLRPEKVPTLKTVFLAGESAGRELIELWVEQLSLFNVYGPSEGGICCSLRHIDAATNHGNIGHATPGAKLWVVNPYNHHQLSPVGAIGELVIQGPNLARGYFDDEEKTAAAFIDHVDWLCTTDFTRIYKTGDLVRYAADGSLDFIGRKDNQVKLRGQRIEPGEVEHHISNYFSDVAGFQVVVQVDQVPHHGLQGQDTLVAYFTYPDLLRDAANDLEADGSSKPLRSRIPQALKISHNLKLKLFSLKQFLATTLPIYMIPRMFVPMEGVPVNISGKTDRNLLRSIGTKLDEAQMAEYSLGRERDRVKPRSPNEQTLLDLWCRVLKLGKEEISVRDDFFTFGDSVAAIMLAAAARDDGFLLTVLDVFRAPSIEAQALVMVKQIEDASRPPPPFSLIADRESALGQIVSHCGVEADQIEDIFPCTEAQFRTLHYNRLGASTTPSVSPTSLYVFMVSAEIDIKQLRLAWLTVVNQVSMLRTRVSPDVKGGAFQAVISSLPDWEVCNALDTCLARGDFCAPTSLGQQSMSVRIVQEEGSSTFLTIQITPYIHDIAFVQALMELLHCAYVGSPGKSMVPYSRFVANLAQSDEASSAVYWSSKLASPSWVHFPEVQMEDAPLEGQNLSNIQTLVSMDDVQDKLRTEALLRLAWAVTLSNQTLTDDILFGVLYSGRDVLGLKDEFVAGPTETYMPCRVKLTGASEIGVLLDEVLADLKIAIPHARFGLGKIHTLGINGELAARFRNVLTVREAFVNAPELSLVEKLSRSEIPGFPLTLECILRGDRLSDNLELSLSFDESVLTQNQASTILQQMQTVLSQFSTKGLKTRLSDIDLLSPQDYRQLASWNASIPCEVESVVHAFFGNQVQNQPQALAIDSWDGSLTYQELDDLSSRLALHLIEIGLTESSSIIPLCFEKSLWVVVAIWGVVKAGGTFLLLDPAYPSQRLRAIVDAAESRGRILCSPRYATKASSLAADPLVVDRTLFKTSVRPLPEGAELVLPKVDPGAIIYVFFTSGSSGTPKGHLTSHRSFSSSVMARAAVLGLRPGVRHLLFASFGFDISISDILVGLCGGACVCIPSEDERLDDLTGAMAHLRVSSADLTPTVARLLDPERLPDLSNLILSGEAVADLDVAKWASRLTLTVGYGPSECSVHSLINPKLDSASNPRNIGFAANCNCRSWVVDPRDHGRLCPIGTIGELVIEGPSVGQGYLEAKKNVGVFIEPPAWLSSFGPDFKTCGRFYKTGDLVRYAVDGSIIYMGRKDFQVKLNGQRVELEEIDTNVRSVMLEMGLSFSDVVTELVQPGGLFKHESLVVFVEFKDEMVDMINNQFPNWQSSVQERLATCLPAGLVPRHYLRLDRIPMLPSGKIDRRTLRHLPTTMDNTQLGSQPETTVEKEQPTSAKEHKLRKWWAQVLSTSPDKIGIRDNFFHMGGDSIAAIKLVGECHRNKYQLTVAGIFIAPTLAEMAELMAEAVNTVLSQEHRRAVDLIARVSRDWDLDVDAVEDVYSATPLQSSLIALTTRNKKTNTLRQVFLLQSTVDLARFKSAWERVFAREPILRTRIVYSKSSILQVVSKENISWQTSTNLQDYLDHDDELAFSYGTPLGRFALLPGKNGTHYFVWTAHHVIYDGWSYVRILNQVKEVYQGRELPPSVPFKNFIHYLDSMKNPNSEDFWKSEFRGFTGAVFPALSQSEYWPLTDRAIEHTIVMPPRSGAARTATLPSVIRCAWALTIGIITGVSDVSFGAVQTGRNAPLPGIPDMMGPTITVVPVRVQWSDSVSITQLLQEAQRQSTETIPFEHLGIKAIRSLDADCLAACSFQSLLTIQPGNKEGLPTIPGMRLVEKTDTEYPSYLLSIQCSIERDNVVVYAAYDSTIMSAEGVQGIVEQFEHVLHQVAVASDAEMVRQLEIITPKDLELVKQWNSMRLEPTQETIVEAIEKQMTKHPEAAAICLSGKQEISYGELDKLSACLALRLCELGVGPEVMVPVCVEKSLWAVVAVLAVLRAGGVCVTLDPTQPPSRHHIMLEDLEAKILLTSPQCWERFQGIGLKVLTVDRPLLTRLQAQRPASEFSAASRPKPENTAFVVFTSGSTGKPKGILLSHDSICATGRGNVAALELSATSRVLQFASFAFDVAIEDICITLMHGACLCVVSDDDRLNNLSGAISDMRVTWADITPSVLKTLEPDTVPSLKTIVVGGEMLTDDLVSEWSDRVHLFNTYGPAECTIYSTATSVLNVQSRGDNIGHAIGCACWVVDSNDRDRLLPIGHVGELLIEGPNVARGYLADPEKTRRAFVTPEWLTKIRDKSSRCYATGDLVQQLSDGSIAFVGRKDTQVKLRGQRIELGEIEHQIATRLPDNLSAAVEVIRPMRSSSQQTLAVFMWRSASMSLSQTEPPTIMDTTPSYKSDLASLNNDLASILPKYMIPSIYISISHPPLSATGKLNRSTLRELGASLTKSELSRFTLGSESVKEHRALTEDEKALRKLWATVLAVHADTISLNDSFFEVGGESVAAIRLTAAARRAGLQITVADIFKNPSLAEMASCLRIDEEVVAAPSRDEIGSELTARVSREWNIEYENIQDLYACTWLQNDMIEVTRRERRANILRHIVRLSKDIDVERYRSVWQRIAAANSIFRTRIVRLNATQILQVVVDERIQWQTAPTLGEYIERDQSIPFDYGTPLVRFGLIERKEGDGHDFVFTSHHATYDGWCLTQLDKLVTKLYQNRSLSPAAAPSYKDLVRYIERLEASNEHADFWRSQLRDFHGKQFPPLPPSHTKPLTQSRVDSRLSLTALSPSSGVTLSTLVRAAYAIVIAQETQVTDTCFGAVQAGRLIALPGIADMMGPAITIVPVRTRWEPASTVRSLLSSMWEQSTRMIPYEHVSKDKLAVLDHDCAAACAYNSLLIVQPQTDDSQGLIPGATVVPTEYPEFLEYGLGLECKLGQTEMDMYAYFDDKVVSLAQVTRLVQELEQVLNRLTGMVNDDRTDECVGTLIRELMSTKREAAGAAEEEINDGAREAACDFHDARALVAITA